MNTKKRTKIKIAIRGNALCTSCFFCGHDGHRDPWIYQTPVIEKQVMQHVKVGLMDNIYPSFTIN